MTDDDLKKLLLKLNISKTNRLIQLKPLSDFVDFAKVWDKIPNPNDEIVSSEYLKLPYSFYFIKNDDGIYVGTVWDMETDLHIYVLPEYRKKGYLTTAFKEIILNHIFQKRDQIRITIDKNHHSDESFIIAEKIAINLGFVKQPEINAEIEYILNKAKYRAYSPMTEQYTGLDESKMRELKKEINYLSRYLRFLQTEIEMKMNDKDLNFEMNFLNEQLSELSSSFEDAWWRCESVKTREG